MTLDQLIDPLKDRLQILERKGDLRVPIADVTDDSRRVKPGALFVAVKGERVDGHEYVQAAIRSGAGAVVAQRELTGCDVPLVRVRIPAWHWVGWEAGSTATRPSAFA